MLVYILALRLTSRVTWGKLLNFSGSHGLSQRTGGGAGGPAAKIPHKSVLVIRQNK